MTDQTTVVSHLPDPAATYRFELAAKIVSNSSGSVLLDANVAWGSVPYANIVAFQRELVDVLAQTVDWGKQVAEAIGQPVPTP